MLVLSRKIEEEILITIPPGDGGQIRIMLVGLRSDKARLGVTAPRHWPVHRGEVARAIEEQHKAKADREQPEEIVS